MVEVTIQDKMAPVILDCPGTVYLNCAQDYTNLSLTGGEPSVEDNCDNFEIQREDKVYLSNCGTGYIKRIWTVVDGSDVSVTCTQYIYIEDNDDLTYDDIQWPKDIEMPGCNAIDAKPELTGSPELIVNSCKDIGIGYSDQVINAQGSCLEILREWKVGDWCETPPYTYITHTQVITIQEKDLPYFNSCDDIVVDSVNDFCEASVTVTADASDDCTPKDQLKYTWEIDFDKDGGIDASGTSSAFTRSFPFGKHWVYFTVSDICGNETICKRELRVKDTKDPTPVCLAKVTTTMMSTGMVPVEASTFNICQGGYGSSDNCTAKEDLRFSFSSDVNYTERIFTCDDITNGVAETFALEMWVTDLDGNQDFCNVELIIMDNVQVCEDADDASASLSGFIVNEKFNGMPEFEVELAKDETEIYQEITNDEGLYVFQDLDVYSKYRLKPRKDNDPANGVSTLDLVLIQKHILGLIPLNTPYKLIAADANNTGSISAADLLEIRSLILGTTDDFDKNESWRFINGTFEFENPNAPWEFEDEFTVDELYLDSDSINFIGIKVGDVNNSAIQNYTGTDLEPRSMETLELVCADQELTAGNTINVPVYIESDQMISGFQFTLDYSAKDIIIEEITSSVLNLQPHNLNYNHESDGRITISWNLAGAKNFNGGTEILNLKVKSQHRGWISEYINISSAITKAEAYDDQLKVMEIGLRFNNESLQQMQVYQNQPNPFTDETAIRFYLPEDSDIDITVYDTNGKIITNEYGHYSKGMNSITLQKDVFNYQGIYFFKITKDEISVVKKMILSR